IGEHPHPARDAGVHQRRFELGLLLPPPSARRPNDGRGAREPDAGLGRRPASGLHQHGSGSGRSRRPHGRTRPVGPAEDLRRRPENDGGMGAAGVGPEEDGGRWSQAGSARPNIEDAIPTATVTAVPSGTYHGHASPGSTRHGTPSTTGVMASTLAMIATTTSRWRARDHHPPSR